MRDDWDQFMTQLRIIYGGLAASAFVGWLLTGVGWFGKTAWLCAACAGALSVVHAAGRRLSAKRRKRKEERWR